jgi:hypothetical protein
MAYTTIDLPTEYFNTTAYTGDGVVGRNLTTGIFQPDWVWIKSRSDADNHRLVDAVRGATKHLESDNDTAEQTSSNVTAFTPTGITLSSNGAVNANTETYVAWAWLGANSTASNTDGSITSTVSANTTSGFSIVSYTGNGTDNDTATIGHGLGVAPNFIITKCRSEAGGWISSSTSLGWNNVVSLNTDDASSAGTQAFGVTGVTPSSITFTVSASSGGNHTNINNATYIAYCFAEKKGFSKFGSYTGNGSADGTFVYTGFKPAFVMVKRTDTSGDWPMVDSGRDPYNVAQYGLYANSTTTESNFGSPTPMYDFNSNGFKIRNTFANTNASGGTYIYMAFAENPFVTSTSIPTTAR